MSISIIYTTRQESEFFAAFAEVLPGNPYCIQQDQAMRLPGRPPFAPRTFAAVPLALDLVRPVCRLVAATNKCAPKARSTSPGT